MNRKLRDELIDQVRLNFVTPDEISVLSWVREPNSEEFVEKIGDSINVSVGSQAAFIPIPKYDGNQLLEMLMLRFQLNLQKRLLLDTI